MHVGRLAPLMAIRRGLLIQVSTRNNLEALNLDVDLIALTAHELAPHSREFMFMNGLRACG